MFVKSTRFKQVCQLLLSLIVVSKMLGSVIRLRNLDPNRYKGHSFRIGAATYAAEQGVSDDKIRHSGRWKSDAFKKYIRITSRIRS